MKKKAIGIIVFAVICAMLSGEARAEENSIKNLNAVVQNFVYQLFTAHKMTVKYLIIARYIYTGKIECPKNIQEKNKKVWIPALKKAEENFSKMKKDLLKIGIKIKKGKTIRKKEYDKIKTMKENFNKTSEIVLFIMQDMKEHLPSKQNKNMGEA